MSFGVDVSQRYTELLAENGVLETRHDAFLAVVYTGRDGLRHPLNLGHFQVNLCVGSKKNRKAQHLEIGKMKVQVVSL